MTSDLLSSVRCYVVIVIYLKSLRFWTQKISWLIELVKIFIFLKVAQVYLFIMSSKACYFLNNLFIILIAFGKLYTLGNTKTLHYNVISCQYF